VSETSPPLVVAVDGPGGSGKSTVARGVARRLGLSYLDTGAIYRAVAWRVLRDGRNPWDRRAAAAAAEEVRIELETDPDSPVVTVDGVDVSRSIRGEAVTAAVSPVSAVPEVRDRMVARQREIIAASADTGGIVVEGRDIGTVVAPDAAVKVFLTASARERARRRAEEVGKRPGLASDAEIARTQEALATRDRLDSTRPASPLVQAPDALVIDSTELDVEEVVDLVVRRCSELRVRGAGGVVREPFSPSARVRPVLANPPRWRPRLAETLKKPVRPLINHVLLRVRVYGLEHVPRTGGLIVAGGHAGWLDGPLVVIESRRPVRCLAKSELYASPKLAKLLDFAGQIPLERGTPDRSALHTCLAELAAGVAVGVFPEGTRGTGELDSVHDGIAYLAVHSGCPLVPVACIGTELALPKHAHWPRRSHPVHVVFGEPFTVAAPAQPWSRRAVAEVGEAIRVRLLDHLSVARDVALAQPPRRRRRSRSRRAA